jgi:hypothetical protein
MNDTTLAMLDRFIPHPRVAARLVDPDYMARILWQMQAAPWFALPDDKAPAALCGVLHRLGVGEVWMLPGMDFAASARRILPMQRGMIEVTYKALGLRRLQMLVEADWPEAQRYAEHLGFVREYDKPARALGHNGTDVFFYIYQPKGSNND